MHILNLQAAKHDAAMNALKVLKVKLLRFLFHFGFAFQLVQLRV